MAHASEIELSVWLGHVQKIKQCEAEVHLLLLCVALLQLMQYCVVGSGVPQNPGDSSEPIHSM